MLYFGIEAVVWSIRELSCTASYRPVLIAGESLSEIMLGLEVSFAKMMLEMAFRVALDVVTKMALGAGECDEDGLWRW